MSGNNPPAPERNDLESELLKIVDGPVNSNSGPFSPTTRSPPGWIPPSAKPKIPVTTSIAGPIQPDPEDPDPAPPDPPDPEPLPSNKPVTKSSPASIHPADSFWPLLEYVPKILSASPAAAISAAIPRKVESIRSVRPFHASPIELNSPRRLSPKTFLTE